MKVIVFESVVLGRHAYGKGKHDIPRLEALILIKMKLARVPGPEITDVEVKRTVKKDKRTVEKPKRTINEVVNRGGNSPSVKRRKRSRSKNASPRKPRK